MTIVVLLASLVATVVILSFLHDPLDMDFRAREARDYYAKVQAEQHRGMQRHGMWGCARRA